MNGYFDNAATSYPKPEQVYRGVEEFMRNNGMSPGRGGSRSAVEADEMIYRARKALAKLLGVRRPSRIVFTANATEALNLALKGILPAGGRVLTTRFEHNAMWRPLKRLERERNVTISPIPGGPEELVDLEGLERQLALGADLLAVTHGSNVTGAIVPLEEVGALAGRYGVPLLVDAAQTAGAIPIRAEQWGVDLLAFTGHKGLLGPTGTGGLYLGEGIRLETLREGGTGSMALSPDQPEEPPDRYEAGTLNSFGLAGLEAAAGFLLERGVETIRAHETALTERLLRGLEGIPRVTRYGPGEAARRLGLVCFNLEGMDPYEVARALDEEHRLMVRAGLHCAPQAHRELGTEGRGAVRASVGWSTAGEDVERLIGAVAGIAERGVVACT